MILHSKQVLAQDSKTSLRGKYWKIISKISLGKSLMVFADFSILMKIEKYFTNRTRSLWPLFFKILMELRNSSLNKLVFIPRIPLKKSKNLSFLVFWISRREISCSYHKQKSGVQKSKNWLMKCFTKMKKISSKCVLIDIAENHAVK